jgi:hypothetical protein
LLKEVKTMMFPSMIKKAVLVAAVAASVPAFASTNLIVNGSFEDTSVANGKWDIFSSMTGWGVGPRGVEIRNNVAGFAQDGNNFVELDTTKNSHIFQDVQTIVGQTYNLTFWYSPRVGVSEGSNAIVASWNGSKFKVSGESASTSWIKVSYSVIGTGHDHLSFNAAGKSDSFGGSLDNVSLTVANVAAVPEPESYAMLLAGLGVMGAVARRRSKKA